LKQKIDINCDLGESFGAFNVGNDATIMPNITSANVACGFHAGDPVTISKTVTLAKKNGIAVGAHPGFLDIMGFGRREMQLAPEEIRNYIIYQIGALQGFTNVANTSLQHVKPHGAMYNMAAKNSTFADEIIGAIKTANKELIVFAPPKSALAIAAKKAKLSVAYEVFADRAYNSDGSLVSRSKRGSIINEPERVVERAVKMVEDKAVLSIDGTMVDFGDVHTICVHGDTLGAVRLVASLKKGLVNAGLIVESVGNFM
jgi:UPF0271 protein